MPDVLKKTFYEFDTTHVARALLGTCLVHDSPEGRCVGRIVETEAYLSLDDPASHAHRGKTARNAAMFGPAGHAYIYFIYGMHCCFNVVTAAQDRGEAVLIRALEPLHGLELMQQRRKTTLLKNLCSGPGKLVQALGLTRAQNGCSLLSGALTIHDRARFGGSEPFDIDVSPRIGISAAADLPLRFSIRGSRFVSR